VSRWRRRQEYLRAIEKHHSEAAEQLSGRLVELANQALDQLESLLDYSYQKNIQLRAAIAICDLAGIGRIAKARAGGRPKTDAMKGSNR
jgi:hypothetical protein